MSFELDVLQKILAEQKKTNELLEQLLQQKEPRVIREKNIERGNQHDDKQKSAGVRTKRRGA